MIDEPAQHSPVELDLLDVQGWHTVYWVEIERRIGSLFARSQARERAISYLAALLSPAERKIAGNWPRSAAIPIPMAFSICLGAPTGIPISCATSCAAI